MRILFFADNFYPEVNAPATHIYERCRLWATDGHDVTVITCQPNFPEGKVYPGYRNRLRQVEIIDGIRVVRVWTYLAANRGKWRRALDYASFVPMAWFAALWEKRPDVIISSSPHLLVPLAGVLASWCKWTPHVFELRDLWPASLAATGMVASQSLAYRVLARLERWLYRRSRRILSFTQSFADDLTARGVPPDKIDVVLGGAAGPVGPTGPEAGAHLTPDKDLARELHLEDRFVVGYLGTLGLAHGLENVLAAAELLVDQPVTFLFVGEGAARDGLIADADQRGVTNVQFVPRQPKEEIWRYWSLVDAALVHLADHQVFATVIPSKIFEAMSVGRPILFAGPDGEAAALVRRHSAGLTTAPSDPAALAAAVNQLHTDAVLRDQLAKASSAAAGEYTRRRQADRTLEVLQRAID